MQEDEIILNALRISLVFSLLCPRPKSTFTVYITDQIVYIGIFVLRVGLIEFFKISRPKHLKP